MKRIKSLVTLHIRKVVNIMFLIIGGEERKWRSDLGVLEMELTDKADLFVCYARKIRGQSKISR